MGIKKVNIKSIKPLGKMPVYNMTVSNVHNYMVQGGIISKNCDSLRCFCVWFDSPADVVESAVYREWTADMWEDYENANEKDKAFLISKYGEPRR